MVLRGGVGTLKKKCIFGIISVGADLKFKIPEIPEKPELWEPCKLKSMTSEQAMQKKTTECGDSGGVVGNDSNPFKVRTSLMTSSIPLGPHA